jgi:hypothetical protein
MRVLAHLVLLLVLGLPPAHAAPVVTVKGRTSLRVIGVSRTASGVAVQGELLDRDLGTGVKERVIEVVLVEGDSVRTRRVMTDADGRFTLSIPGVAPTLTSFRVSARFRGDHEYAADAQDPQELDVTKASLELELGSEGELDGSRASQQLKVRTVAEGQPVSVQLSLRLEGGRHLGTLQTGADGKGALEVRTRDLGELGSAVLVAHFAGDERFNPVTRRHELLLSSPVSLTLQAPELEAAADGEIVLAGTVRDTRAPLAGATVALEAMGRHTASALSDGAGHFAFRLSAAEFPPGRLELVARFTPTQLWHRAAASPLLAITILPPRPIPVGRYLALTTATLLTLTILLLVRFAPSLRRILARRGRRPREEVAPGADGDEPPPVAAGVQFSRRGLRGMIHPAFDVSGRIFDASDRIPIAGAEVTVVDANGVSLHELESAADGSFRIPPLPAGQHTVHVLRRGYVSERFAVQLPHRGNLHDVRVDLAQVRVRILELYRGATLRLLPAKERWACWTPRETVRHVGRQAGRRLLPLEDLTLLLERAYWSGALCEESELPQAVRLAGGVSLEDRG